MIGRAISESVPLPAGIGEEFLSSEAGTDGLQPSHLTYKYEFYPHVEASYYP
jgi:hypothetical protein